MHFIRFLSLALVGLVAAQGPKHILQPAGNASKNVIRGLLGRSRISSRQADGCQAGYSICDVNYCCPATNVCCTGGFCCAGGTYCDVVSGTLGCCQDGEICTETSNVCSTAGYSPCPNDTYCCPTGDTCSRDAAGNAQCNAGGGGSSTVVGGGGGSSGTTTFPVTSTQVISTPAVSTPTTTVIVSTPTTTPLVVTKTSTTSQISPSSSGSSGSGLGGLTNSGMYTGGNNQGLVVLPVIGFVAAFLL